MKYVAYIRVSTKQQSLGLEAQRETIMQYVARNGGEIVAEYSEKESGKNDDRKALAEATAHAKKIGGTIIVAKIDRLSRKLSFGAKFVESNKVVFCDHPTMLTAIEQGIFFGMAQQEREYISMRTKVSLKALSDRFKDYYTKYLAEGGTLDRRAYKEAFADFLKERKAYPGGGKYQPENLKMAQQAKHDQSLTMSERQAFGAIEFVQGSLRAKAKRLNDLGYTTPKGCQWNAKQVSRLIQKFAV